MVSKLKNDEGTHAHRVESTRSHSNRYLLLMDAFPSTLGNCTCRKVYVHGSLTIGLLKGSKLHHNMGKVALNQDWHYWLEIRAGGLDLNVNSKNPRVTMMTASCGGGNHTGCCD